jgi:hypothetical protein
MYIGESTIFENDLDLNIKLEIINCCENISYISYNIFLLKSKKEEDEDSRIKLDRSYFSKNILMEMDDYISEYCDELRDKYETEGNAEAKADNAESDAFYDNQSIPDMYDGTGHY